MQELQSTADPTLEEETRDGIGSSSKSNDSNVQSPWKVGVVVGLGLIMLGLLVVSLLLMRKSDQLANNGLKGKQDASDESSGQQQDGGTGLLGVPWENSPEGIKSEALISQSQTLFSAAIETDNLYPAGRAIDVAKEALQVAERAVGPNHPYLTHSITNLAGIYFSLTDQRYKVAAKQLLKRAVAINQKAYGHSGLNPAEERALAELENE